MRKEPKHNRLQAARPPEQFRAQKEKKNARRKEPQSG